MNKLFMLMIVCLCCAGSPVTSEAYIVKYLCPAPADINFSHTAKQSWEASAAVEIIFPASYPAFFLHGKSQYKSGHWLFTGLNYQGIRHGDAKLICHYQSDQKKINLIVQDVPEVEWCQTDGRLEASCSGSRQQCRLKCEVM